MTLFSKLAAAATLQGEEGDLPLWLATEILKVADSPEAYREKADLVQILLEQVENFDSYAGAGCFGDAVSAGTIEATLRRITGNRSALRT